MAVRVTEQANLWGAALLLAVEPTDRALDGWGPSRNDKAHPRAWAQWMLRWLAEVT